MDDEFLERLERFFERNRLIPVEQLGFGIHGKVWLAQDADVVRLLAVKIFERSQDYRRERDAYFRLAQFEVDNILGCDVPLMVIHDDEELAIAMTVVERPFVLDFAGSQLDWPLDFEPEIMAAWMAEKEAQFGEDDWPVVLEILGELESMGIYLTDITPSNISLIDRRV